VIFIGIIGLFHATPATPFTLLLIAEAVPATLVP